MRSFIKINHISKVIFSLSAVMFFGLHIALAQRTININSEKTLSSVLPTKGSAEQSRLFEHNPKLKTLTGNNTGDTLALDLFDNKKYKAVITRVSKSYDGITGITAKIVGVSQGYCFISVSDRGISVSVELPEFDEQFFVAGKNDEIRLSRHKMSDILKDELECSDIHIHEDEDKDEDEAASGDPSGFAADALDLSKPVTIDVLVVYTKKAKNWAAGTGTVSDIDDLISQAMLKGNQAMDNSLTNITLNLAYKYETNYDEVNSAQDLHNLRNRNDGYMDEVHDLRKQYKADLVMLLTEVSFTGGLGFVLNNENGSPSYAFALSRVQQTASTHTMVHEIGHNMGCGHHKLQNGGEGLFPYSYGWRGTTDSGNRFSTVMTYENFDGTNYPRIPYFSDPNIMFEGVPVGDANDGNNALTIRQTKQAVSLYSDYYNPALATLSLSRGRLLPDFHPDTVEYKATVPADVASVTIDATATHPSTRIIKNANYPLSAGINSITVTAQSEDKTTDNPYKITVTRADPNASSDATLSNIELSVGTLVPPFSSERTDYTANPANEEQSVVITATPNHAAAVVVGDGEKPLKAGANIFEIAVVAEDGSEKTYTVNVIVFIDNELDLSNLTVSNGTLTPPFDARIRDYRVDVDSDVHNITLTAGALHPNAIVTGTGTKQLYAGDNVFPIEVTIDNVKTKIYTVTVNRTASTDATLKSLTVSVGKLVPEFKPETAEYAVYISNSTDSVDITGTASYPDASVEGNVTGQKLAAGSNIVPLTVTAEDGSTRKTYTVTVVRDASVQGTEAQLLSLKINDTPAVINSNEINYIATCGQTVLNLEPTISPYASVKVNGEYESRSIPLSGNVTAVDIQVVSETGNIRNYTLKATAPLNGNQLYYQRWSDVLAINNNREHNGGYDISAIRWYRQGDNTVISTENYIGIEGSHSLYYADVQVNGEWHRVCGTPSVRSFEEIVAYPNPVLRGGVLTLHLPEKFAGGYLNIYDIRGALVKSGVAFSANITSVNTGDLSSGIYLLHFIDKNGLGESVKIVVE
ncbi:MAG: cadherin-like beta sandwich domain-containing protein [Prevotellaceae bacterium]|jgi:hypothetical protein|nr:cadherin-like beta sandwich domain-containing protein [Prevotellaceae bacterium]